MDNELKILILDAQALGYVVFVKPKLKVIRLHGFKTLNYIQAKAELKLLLNKSQIVWK